MKDDEAGNFPDDILDTCERWWHVFAEADKAGKLDDVDYLQERLIREAGIVLPDLEVSKMSMRVMLGMINLFKKMFRKKPIRVAEIQMKAVIDWLAKGYTTYNAQG